MKKVLILTRFRGEYEPRRLAEEAAALGYEVDRVNYEKVRVAVDGEMKVVIDLGTGTDLLDYDKILMRAASARGKSSMVWKKTVITEFLAREKKEGVLNLETFARFPMMGKLEQGVLLAAAGIRVTPFDSFEARSWEKVLKQKLDFPLVLKGRFGSHGKKVRVVNTHEELEKKARVFKSGTILLQEVLKVRRWYRVLVLNGDVLGVMKHRQKDRYIPEEMKEEVKKIKPNLSEEEMDKLREVCLAAAKVFQIDYAGLDVAWDENRKTWVVWEINRTAQFKWFEKAHPEVNVAREIFCSR